MDKQWVEDVTKSPQYKYGLLHWYLNEFNFEKDPNVPASQFYDSDDSDDDFRNDNPQKSVAIFLKQVRESRGYDVDIMVPRRFSSPFRPVDMDELESEDYKADMMKGLNLAMKKINEESEEVTGKTYEFVEFKKIVETSNLMLLFTFTARVRNAEAKDAGVDAKDAGTDAKDAGTCTKDAGADVKDAGADAKDDGAVKTLQAMVYVPFGAEPELCEWRVKPVPDATEGLNQGVPVLPLKG